MQAVILAAGESTRTKPLTETKPKAMLTVANKAILDHQLEMLDSEHVHEIVIVTGHYKEKLEEHIRNNYPKLNVKLVEQIERKGTAHALGQCKDLITEDFIMLYGDILFDSSLLDMAVQKYKETNEQVLTSTKVDNPSDYGILSVEGDDVRQIIEKPENPATNLANLGIYILKPEIFEAIDKTQESERGEYELTESLQIMLDEGKKIKYVDYEGYLHHITYPWDLLDLNEHFLKQLNYGDKRGTIEQGVMIKGDLEVGGGTIIKSGTYIEGPAVIGKNSIVGPNAYIRPFTSIGDNCYVGGCCEVKDSIVMDGTHIAHLCYVGDSILSENVNFSGGTITANLRHDEVNVKSMVKGELVDTGRRKFGTVVGEGAKTGIGTKINPGRKIWPGKTTMPGEIITKDIDNS